MTYQQRLSLLIVTDSLVLISAIIFSRLLLDENMQLITLSLVVSSIALLFFHHLFFFVYKLYKKAWEYASVGELISILKVVTLAVVATAIIQQLVTQDIYYRLLMTTWMLYVLLVGGSRICWRIFRGRYTNKDSHYKRTLIVGAGSAGTMLGRQLLNNRETDLLPVAFIDDNSNKHNLHILGIPVAGGVKDIEKIAIELHIDHIVIAIPSLSRKELNNVYSECAKSKARTQIIPMLEDLASGRISINEFRDVQVEDLLGREPVELDIESISGYMTNKVVLVTGAGGSIGSEVCRQIAKFHPETPVSYTHLTLPTNREV